MSRIHTHRILALVTVCIAALLLTGGPQAKDGLAQTPPPDQRPNVIFVLADDMDKSIVPHMPNLKSLMSDKGMTFENAFVTDSVCCPSRATSLRGQYAHNHGVLTNSAPLGGYQRFKELGREESTIATWLQSGGYQTAFVGKYLNDYGKDDPRFVPPGWDEWYAFTPPGYPNFRLNENGTLVQYQQSYSTDVLADKADGYIRRAAGGAKPFFMYVSPYAPHLPSTPAPRHAGLFANEKVPRTPSFNEADTSDKPQWVRNKPLLTSAQIAEYDENYRNMLRSSQAVDDMLKKLVDTLQASGELDNTYIVFTSDNGFHMGPHRLTPGKWTAYEEAIRVPLIVRGPGVPAGKTPQQFVLNNDFAPTFAELAGVNAPSYVDGRSLVPLLNGSTPSNWRSAFLEEAATAGALNPGGSGRPAFEAVRTTRHLYVEYETGERELYDLQTDPYQLNNFYATASPALLKTLQDRLAALRGCKEAACREAEDGAAPPNSPSSLSTTPSPSGIALNWDDNKESDLAGYNVYRSATDGGTYTRLNAGLLTASSYNDTSAPQGRDSFYRVTAVNMSGNESTPTTASSFREDTTAPETIINSGPAGPTNDNTPTYTFSATDNVAPVEKLLYSYKVDGGAWSGYSSATMATLGGAGGLSAGSHTFYVRAKDEKGNVDASPAQRAFTVDTSAPQTTADPLPPDPQKGGSVSLTFSSDESGSTFGCSLDGGPYSACSSPKEYTGLSDGTHTFRVRATDAAGNTDATPAERNFTVVSDSTPPQTTTDPLPPGAYRSSSVSLTFSSDESGSTFECSLDGAAFSGCSSPKAYTGLSDGQHTFRVRATDEAGNTDATPAQRVWTVDTKPPSGTVVIKGGAASTSSRTVSLTLSASDPVSAGSGVDEMRFRNESSATWTAWEPYATTRSWELSAGSGTKTVYVQYMDKAGNVSTAVQDTIVYSSS